MSETTSLLDVARFANFMGRDPGDDAVHFAVELAENLILSEMGASTAVPDPVPPGLTALAFSVAARLVSAPPGVASEGEGGTSFTYRPDAGTLVLTDAERTSLNRVLRRYGGLGTIGITSPSAGRRRFDPYVNRRTERVPGTADGHWARGSQ